LPVNVVRTKEDEDTWEEAKRQAAKEGRAKDWKYIMGIFQHMKHHSGSKDPEDKSMGQAASAKAPVALVVSGKRKARAVISPRTDEDDGVVGPEGFLSPDPGILRSLREPGRGYVRVPMEFGGRRYLATIRVDLRGKPDGHVVVRDSHGHPVLESPRLFDSLQEVLEYCRQTLGELLPEPVYPKRRGAIVGDQEGDASDAENQVQAMQENDPMVGVLPEQGQPRLYVHLDRFQSERTYQPERVRRSKGAYRCEKCGCTHGVMKCAACGSAMVPM
jgi:hypothetical protein